MYKIFVRFITCLIVLSLLLPSTTSEASSNTFDPGKAQIDPDQVAPPQVSPTWNLVSTIPEPLGYFGLAHVNGSIFTFGGTNWGRYPNPTDVIRKFDPVTKIWQNISIFPEPLQQKAVSLGEKIYIFGGNKNNIPSSSTWEYDTSTNQWSQKSDLPSPRMANGVTVLNGKFYIVGGTMSGSSNYTDTMFVYDPILDSWSEAAPMPTSRMHLTATSAKGKIYAFGGWAGGGLSVVEAYDPLTNTWTTKSNMPISRWIDQNDSIENNGKVYFIGGCTGGYTCTMLSRVDVYDVETDTWSSLPDLPIARTGGGVAIVNEILYSFGGYKYGTFYANVYAYALGQCIAPSGLNVCNLEPGDILLSRSPKYKALFSLGGTYFTHAVMYIGKVAAIGGGQDTVMHRIVEAQGYEENDADDVWETNLLTHRDWTGDDILDFAVIRPPFSKDVKDLAIEYIREKALSDNATFELPSPKWTTDKFYCSKLVWRAYLDVPGGGNLEVDTGYWSDQLNTWVTPDDLYYSIIFGSKLVQSKLWLPWEQIVLALYSPAHIMLVDPEGRRTGFDPGTNTILEEIPLAIYTAPPDAEVETITAVGVGDDWKVVVTGYDTGSYVFEQRYLDWKTKIVIENGVTEPGKIEEYMILDPVYPIYLPITIR